VRGALSYAHRQGVVHGDLKPANVLLDEDGNAYLSDFGIASRLASASESPRGATSSPAYVTPEELRGEPRTARSDLYCLGLLTFELVTGRRPPMDGSLPSVSALRPEVPKGLDDVIARASADDPDERYDSADAFVAAAGEVFGAQPRGLDARYTAAENPYQGLRAFGEADAEHFYGRDAVVEELLGTLAERRLVAVVGPSGIGKSSVVRAGLVPAVREGRLPGSESWLLTDLFPGSYPFEELAAALLRVAVTRPDELVDELERDELGMARVVKRILPPDTDLLLVVDQFEELFTLTTDEETRRRFLDGLTRLATDPRSRARVVVTLRADFLDQPLSYPEFGELLREGLCAVTVPSEDDLAAAIERPAAQVGVRFEPGLVSKIIADVHDQPGALPLLQYALTELFAGRTADLLSGEGYRWTGGVVGALGRRAEELYERLDPSARKAARQVFLRLVTVDPQAQDTRRRVRRLELRRLEVEPEALDDILGRYGEHRLLTFDREPLSRSPTVEVAHEALLDQWERLRSWVDERREDLLLNRRLVEAVEEWEESGRTEDYLPREGRLAQFESWASATDIGLTEGEREYLAAGRRRADERRRRAARRRRAVLAVLAVAAAASAALAAAALVSRERAKDQEALAASRELAASAIAVLDRDPELSVLLALEAAEAAEPTYEAVSALHEGLREHRTLWTSPKREPAQGAFLLTSTFSSSLSPDERSVLMTRLNRLEVWDVGGSTPRWEHEFEKGERVHARFSTDGRQVVGAVAWAGRGPAPHAARQGIIFWDAATGREVRYVPPAGPCPAHAFSQNGPFVDPGRPVAGIAYASSTRPGDGPTCDPRHSAVIHLDLRTGKAEELETGDTSVSGSGFGYSTSADGRYVAITTLERAWVVDTETDREVFAVLGDGSTSSALSKDGSKVVTGGRIGPLTLWDVRSRERLGTFGQGSAVQFSEDGDTLVVIGSEGSGVLLYDIASGREQLALRGHQSQVRGASLSRDRSRLASYAADETVRVWRLSPRGEVAGFKLKPGNYGADGVHFANGRATAYVYPGMSAGANLVVFDPLAGKIQTEIPKITGWNSALSPDGRRAAAQQMLVDVSSESPATFGPIRVHDLETGSITTMQGLCVWVNGEENPQCRTAPKTPFKEWVYNLDFSPDGALLAAGGYESGLSVWNPTTGELLFNGGEPEVFEVPTIAFSPDAALLAAVNDTEIVVYDVATWKEVVRQPLEDAWLSKIVFTPDGRNLVGISWAGGNVVVVDTETWEQSTVLSGHRGDLKDVDVSLDGRLLASSDSTGLVRIWNLSTGEALQGIPLREPVQNVEFLDERHVLVTETTGPVYVMTVDVDELLEIARSRVTRDLTDEECRTYLHVDACPSD
jgi:WD40 repeat protein